MIIDSHCHIICDVDDGAPSPEASLRMARIAADSGTGAIIATPHFLQPFRSRMLDVPVLKERFEVLSQAVEAAGIPLELHLGCELYFDDDTPAILRNSDLLTLAGSRYLLIEFPFDAKASLFRRAIDYFAGSNIQLIFAHPERYMLIHQQPDPAIEWFESGICLQLNGDSLTGALGRRSQAASRWLLTNGLYHLVGSDAHNVDGRSPNLAHARALIAELSSPVYARLLLEDNPACILADRPMIDDSEF